MSEANGARAALAEAALKRAAARGWRGVTLHELADLARRPVGDFHPLTPADAFDCVDEYFDRAAAKGASAPNLNDPARERVFDVAMARFEAMEPHRAGVLALDQAHGPDPIAQTAAHARATRTARWLLALAGDEGDGVGAAARTQALAFVLRQARAAWAKDEAGDFAKTMAALDKGLRRSEDFFDQVGKVAAGLRPGQARAKPADEAQPSDPPGPTRPG
jgi:hypothetical protein